MSRFDQFIGPTYSPSAYSVDSQVTKNWYTERAEKPGGDAPYSLLRAPGRKLFCDPGLGAATVRAEYSLDGHSYAVVGNRVIETFANGTCNVFDGAVADDGLPAHMAGNPTQLLIVSGGNGYILAGTLTQIASPDFPTGQALGAAMADQYFVTAIKGSQAFAISSLDDGTQWDAARRGSAEASPDFILQIGAIGPELWPFGGQSVEVFDDTGDIDFPFQPRQDVVITRGIYAAESLTRVGEQWYYLAGGQSGIGMVMRMAGYTPVRVSDHSVENAIRLMNKDSRSDDAVGWTYEENGHVFYVLQFPTADQTWCYDVSVDQWHQRTWVDPATNVEHAHRGYCATSAFGKTIVGDRTDGKLYELGIQHLDDAGDLIHRVRRAPCLDDELSGIVHSNFVLDGNMGLGVDGITDPDDPRYDPKAMLRWSNDGDGGFGQEHWRGFGRLGQRERRAIWRRLGYAYRRVYDLTVTAPVDWAISACYVNMKSTRRG